MDRKRPSAIDRVRLFSPVERALDQQGAAREAVHHENLEEEATHATDEARMILPGVQAIMGFQLIAVFNQKFASLDTDDQLVHLVAFLLVTLAMALIMTPAAYHRLAERGRVSRRFVDLASTLLCLALLPFMVGVSLDAYLIAHLVTGAGSVAAGCGAAVLLVLAALWFGLPYLGRRWRR